MQRLRLYKSSNEPLASNGPRFKSTSCEGKRERETGVLFNFTDDLMHFLRINDIHQMETLKMRHKAAVFFLEESCPEQNDGYVEK